MAREFGDRARNLFRDTVNQHLIILTNASPSKCVDPLSDAYGVHTFLEISLKPPINWGT
ncbi:MULTISPECIES: hypothetical protein [Nostocales]|uniref:Uncharacterized protein n=3 Tax=Nostocales TaxID=1161 RepID=A0A8S9T0E0_9CYAN|nr:hypothetical protein [Tolypothrix bouteillei]KAF3884933.1 hypothetical protein DA73_0400005265 [Tolypothrix bouteillei VB521301]